jgi:hypothetical protein
MKITRRGDYLYIKGYSLDEKISFEAIKNVSIQGHQNKIYSLQLVIATVGGENRYNIPNAATGNRYKETIERFILEWQAKQNVV